MLPGGPAAKLGNRYETWCAVWELVRILHGETESIRIEVPGLDKAEFVVSTGKHREFHQVKRSHPNGNWSLTSLRSDGLLRSIADSLVGNDDRFVFVSGSEARELLELCCAAVDAESVDEFEKSFLAATRRKGAFERLLRCWGCSTRVAVETLRRIDIHTTDERGIVEKVRWAAHALFDDDPERVLSELRAIVEDSVHRSISRAALVTELAKRRFRVRRLKDAAYTALAVENVTDHYLDGVRGRLIHRVLVPRSVGAELLSQLDAAACDSVITGKAGAGKTACVIAVAEGLRRKGQPVLAFRLDRIPVMSTTGELGRHLGLEESPVLGLAAASEAAGRAGVLIVDQLDAVSTMSGRSSEAFDLIERLIQEARGTRAAIHTVVVCRAFDWNNDSRLRQLLYQEHVQINVAEFGREEVESLLKKAEFKPELFGNRQFDLLRLPQNLALFLEAGFDPSREPDFNTATRLFDGYWNKKRRSVGTGRTDQWMPVIERLCDEMNANQQLSVPRERLDHILPEYLAQLASEGVLTFDGHRYGFGHESFFDYCFARVFVNRSESIATVLKASEQHLFRRAQVRQVLAYLREADPQRYVQELAELLCDQGVRPHIKDLAFALLAEVTGPTDEEWAIWEQSTAAAFQGIGSGVESHDKLSVLAWRRFFGSKSWFSYADRHGLLEGWMASKNDRIVDMAVNYLWAHHSHAPDRVASLLEPYADKGDRWVARLRSLMERTQHHTSRRYFDVILRLVDSGALDGDNRSAPDSRSFWLMLNSVGENRPAWIPEAVARHLRRQYAIINWTDQDLMPRDLIGYNKTAEKLIRDAAKHAPTEFVEQLLPVVIDISDSTQTGGLLPKMDAIWTFLSNSEPYKGEDACLIELASALQEVARTDNAAALDAVTLLRRRKTYVANFLLQSLYCGDPRRFAQDSVSLLCNETWRFRCGYSDSPHWCTMELIRSVIPHCSLASREMLENAIVDYVGPFERPIVKYRFNGIGLASFSLLSAIPAEIRSARANRHFHEMERRFKSPDDEPKSISGGMVRSPIAESAALLMSDDQWRRAIMKYRTEHRTSWQSDFLKGGAHELSQVLGKRTKEDPERFAQLCLTFPVDANSLYLERALDALRDAAVDSELKLMVCRKAYSDSRKQCGKSIADVLGSIEDPLPEDTVEMLQWLATEHDDPEKELWNEVVENGLPYYNGDIHMNGINTTRGRAAQAIQRLILTDATYIERLRPAIDWIVTDRSAAVRSCVAGVLQAVGYHDPPLGMCLFLSMDRSEDRLLATRLVEGFIRNHLRDEFPKLRSIIERMLRSTESVVRSAGGRLASISAMIHQSAGDLGDEALHGNRSQRVGAAQVAAGNIGVPQFRLWCETRLLTLFNDDDHDVRQQASFCFGRIPADSIETYADLVEGFCDSRAFAGGAFSLVHALEKSRGRLPRMTSMVCARALDHPSRDTFAVAKLIFRTYQQHQNGEWASHTLNLIDRLCLEGDPSLGSEFEEFDR